MSDKIISLEFVNDAKHWTPYQMLNQVISCLEDKTITAKEGLFLYKDDDNRYHYYLAGGNCQDALGMCEICKDLLISNLKSRTDT